MNLTEWNKKVSLKVSFQDAPSRIRTLGKGVNSDSQKFPVQMIRVKE